MSTRGAVVGVNGNLVIVEVQEGHPVQNEVAYVDLGALKLKAEIIRVQGRLVDAQVFEDTTGIRIGMPVEFTGELLSVELGPGLLGSIYDGLQNPLKLLTNRQGFFLQRGQYAPPIDHERTWHFTPTAKVGATVRAGSFLGYVQELHTRHRLMAPFDLRGTAKLEHLAGEGEYPVTHAIARLSTGREVTMTQRWPVKRALHAFAERLYPQEMLSTGCRSIDTMFPLARGGTACIPGPFGAGKTVLQQVISRYAEVDVVIVVACGERAGEVVETISEFPELSDPKTGGSLMDRTIIICNTSSMPVAAREASIYTGITLAEYYRQMGCDALVLADSTSRWAQALREMSGRLEEIPGEEAFPAYLDTRIAALYERAGLVSLHSGDRGAVTLVGTVSPAGGNFEEPVTQATLKVVGAFHGLSRKRSDERRYPAIDPLDSWSLYAGTLREALDEQLDPNWSEMVESLRKRMRKADEIGRMMTVLGEEGVSTHELVEYLSAELFDAAYLQQNAFDEIDAATPMERQVAGLRMLYAALTTEFEFDTKAEARAFFAELQDAFYQKNYCAFGSEEEAEYIRKIEALCAGERGPLTKTYRGIESIVGDIARVRAEGVGFGELAQLTNPDGATTLAQVVRIDRDEVSLQVFAGTRGLSTEARIRFLGHPMQVPFSDALLGRIFSGSGVPIDGKPPLTGAPPIDLGGPSVNPVKRVVPRNFIETRIPMIDVFNPLVESQKLPIFSQAGEPYNELLARVGLQAHADVIILGGIGLKFDEYIFFKETFERGGVMDRTVMFVHTAADPVVERLLVPDMALAVAEQFAIGGKRVLVLLSDLTAFAVALKEISVAMEQVPSNLGFPSSLYSDLAARYEKAVDFDGAGSITILAVTTMPGGDVTHPVPDNTGYITEGQYYLNGGVIDPFGSLSRLKQLVIGKVTRHDHGALMNAMIRLYARAKDSKRKIAMGFEATETDEKYLRYADLFESRFMDLRVDIPLNDALDLGWKTLAECFERNEVGIKRETLDEFWPA